MTKNKKVLIDTKPEFYFKLIDGSEIKNLLELADALENMSDDSFYFHVNSQKNDFSNWIREVFQEENLADSFSKTGSRLEAEICILRFIIDSLE